jgi:hypothetical protein
MNEPIDSLTRQLHGLDQEIRRRDCLVTCVYGSAALMAVALVAFFPFDLSRIGGVVLVVAFAYMVWRFHAAKRVPQGHAPVTGPWWNELTKVDGQIELCRSALVNLPFVVGANLFWMGLPGTGTELANAEGDCIFLTATVLAFIALYLLNQQTATKRLLPLRKELELLLLQQQAWQD